jgi:ribosomal protein S18 acetylase RimI-like enzyme
MNFEIRRALLEEADRLSHIALSAKAHWGYPVRWMEIWAPQLTFSPEYIEDNDSWVAEMDNHPIAFYTLQDKGGVAWIENLWVLPEYMGQGVGKQLFLDAQSRAREMGHKTLQLEADPNAVGFYEKMGMHKIGERLGEVEGHPRVLPIMEMEI